MGRLDIWMQFWSFPFLYLAPKSITQRRGINFWTENTITFQHKGFDSEKWKNFILKAVIANIDFWLHTFILSSVSVKVFVSIPIQNKVEKASKLKCDLFLSPYLLTSLIPKRPNMHSGTQKQGHKSFLPLSFPMVSEQWTFRGQKGQSIYQKAWCIMVHLDTLFIPCLMKEKFL